MRSTGQPWNLVRRGCDRTPVIGRLYADGVTARVIRSVFAMNETGPAWRVRRALCAARSVARVPEKGRGSRPGLFTSLRKRRQKSTQVDGGRGEIVHKQ